MIRRKVVVGILAVAVVVALLPPVPGRAAGEAIVAGTIRADATFEHIGVVWFVDGDTDLDSTMTLEYRPAAGGDWQPAAQSMRAHPDLVVDGQPLGIDSWGASAMFLSPGTVYELRAIIADPDGGNATATLTATTRVEPAAGPNVRYVVPGNGGGSGTASDPIRGLQAAADAASPGDTFEVAPGTYDPFQIVTSGTPGAPITFRGPTDGEAIVDGRSTDRGVVTIGEYNLTTSFVIVEGLSISEGHWGIDAQNTTDIVIRGNKITAVDDGIVNRRGNGIERSQTVCDNVVVGRTPWPGSGIPSEQGIDLRGWGNVVCHNTVQFFGDCISLEPQHGPSYGNDVYGNDVSYCVDDGIEVDYNQANVRVWRNRVTNSRMGVSVQPIYGGPAYIFRNAMFNLESNPIKLNNQPAGVLVMHNTSVMHGNGQSDGSEFTNTVFRNNLMLGTRYAFEFTTTNLVGFRDFDYGAWGTSRDIDPGGPWFKWNNQRFDRIGDLPAGVEDHGIEVGFGDLRQAQLPVAWNVAIAPDSPDLRLAGDSNAVDAGAGMANLNRLFVDDGRPDMGAFEAGAELPAYGVRTGIDEGFADVPATHILHDDIEWLASQGITKGCNPTGTHYCPDQPVTRGQMAAFLNRALRYPPSSLDRFIDDNGSIFEADIQAIAAQGVTKGCNPTGTHYCPDQPVTRGQMAAFLARALRNPAS